LKLKKIESNKMLLIREKLVNFFYDGLGQNRDSKVFFISIFIFLSQYFAHLIIQIQYL